MIQKREQMDDGIGGLTESWTDYRTTSGYLDLVQGTDLNASQQAFLQESTHVAVIPFYQDGITATCVDPILVKWDHRQDATD